MGRLKRKRPASSKKKGRRKVAKKDNTQAVSSTKRAVDNGALQEPVAPKPVAPKKDMAKAIKPSGRRGDGSIWNKAVQFLREVKVELKKVTWPSRKEAMASTVVVIILVIIVSAFLGLVDVGLSSLVRTILH